MVKHNNEVPHQHFKKDWQSYVKTWFNQPARKKRRRLGMDDSGAVGGTFYLLACSLPSLTVFKKCFLDGFYMSIWMDPDSDAAPLQLVTLRPCACSPAQLLVL